MNEIKSKLIKYCSYRDRCYIEVDKKLDDLNAISQVKEEVLLYLIKNDFLNEERFARMYVRGKFYQKKWGKHKIVNGLKQKQIQLTHINIALKEIDEDEYLETIANLFSKKIKTLTNGSIFERNKKTTNYLIQKGYEYDLIMNIINYNFTKK